MRSSISVFMIMIFYALCSNSFAVEKLEKIQIETPSIETKPDVKDTSIVPPFENSKIYFLTDNDGEKVISLAYNQQSSSYSSASSSAGTAYSSASSSAGTARSSASSSAGTAHSSASSSAGSAHSSASSSAGSAHSSASSTEVITQGGTVEDLNHDAYENNTAVEQVHILEENNSTEEQENIAEAEDSNIMEEQENIAEAEDSNIMEEQENIAEAEGSNITEEQENIAEAEGSNITEEQENIAEAEDSNITEEQENIAEAKDSNITEEQENIAEAEDSNITEEQENIAEAEDSNITEEQENIVEAKDSNIAEEQENIVEENNKTEKQESIAKENKTTEKQENFAEENNAAEEKKDIAEENNVVKEQDSIEEKKLAEEQKNIDAENRATDDKNQKSKSRTEIINEINKSYSTMKDGAYLNKRIIKTNINYDRQSSIKRTFRCSDDQYHIDLATALATLKLLTIDQEKNDAFSFKIYKNPLKTTWTVVFKNNLGEEYVILNFWNKSDDEYIEMFKKYPEYVNYSHFYAEKVGVNISKEKLSERIKNLEELTDLSNYQIQLKHMIITTRDDYVISLKDNIYNREKLRFVEKYNRNSVLMSDRSAYLTAVKDYTFNSNGTVVLVDKLNNKSLINDDRDGLFHYIAENGQELDQHLSLCYEIE